ncbi:hypothetical protein [Algibacter sp. L3A6]|uniref:hypothetical protein n=1 Tax=Algibacter sp. L3A6 TaxID=2686366 RepID=UPI00131E010A|nr:hypothetical protein [Algibacter sp. L3A6]
MTRLPNIFFLLTFLFFVSCGTSDEEEAIDEVEEVEEEPTKTDILYGDNFIVFEPEITKSDLGLWVKRVPGDPKYHVGTGIEAINKGYLEFTGNNLNTGPATSPLEYEFVCPKTAQYRLVMRMYQPLADDEEEDKRNDVYVRLEGDFTSGFVYTTETLETDHKFWGRGVRKWGSTIKLEAEVNGNDVLTRAVYNLKEGETYTFTMSGRAQGTSIDYILFYEFSLEASLGLTIENHTDIATELPENFRPNVVE